MNIVFIVIVILIGGFLASSLLSDKHKTNETSYTDLGDSCWLTPQGFVDLKPRLTIEQEAHNRRNKWETEMRNDRYEYDLALAEIKQQDKQYQLMQKDVEAILPIEKIEKWLPKWIDYLCEWHVKEKNKHELELRYMPFEVFIATEIIPYKSYGMQWVSKKVLGHIEYV